MRAQITHSLFFLHCSSPHPSHHLWHCGWLCTQVLSGHWATWPWGSHFILSLFPHVEKWIGWWQRSFVPLRFSDWGKKRKFSSLWNSNIVTFYPKLQHETDARHAMESVPTSSSCPHACYLSCIARSSIKYIYRVTFRKMDRGQQPSKKNSSANMHA
jgi:hypothetical protein